jgi:hypothetical protein
MIKENVISNISFDDSEYKSFCMSENDTLTVYMNSWQEIPFKIVFKHTIQFLYRLGDVPSKLFVITNESPFLKEALMNNYVEIPADHPYKLYQLEDLDDFPFIQVVAEAVEIIRGV